jgi:hypothetical protein
MSLRPDHSPLPFATKIPRLINKSGGTAVTIVIKLDRQKKQLGDLL